VSVELRKARVKRVSNEGKDDSGIKWVGSYLGFLSSQRRGGGSLKTTRANFQLKVYVIKWLDQLYSHPSHTGKSRALHPVPHQAQASSSSSSATLSSQDKTFAIGMVRLPAHVTRDMILKGTNVGPRSN
jgi:hypothetical protein